MPVVFVPHGGGPWPFVEMGFPREDILRLTRYLHSVRSVPPRRPRALLVVSVHWEEEVPTVMTSEHPPMLYDDYGFPPESYEITWPAPGAPDVALRVCEVLSAAGIANAADSAQRRPWSPPASLRCPCRRPSVRRPISRVCPGSAGSRRRSRRSPIPRSRSRSGCRPRAGTASSWASATAERPARFSIGR